MKELHDYTELFYKNVAMKERIAELEKALEPLAAMYTYTAPDGQLFPSITGEDIVRARAALEGKDD